MKKFSQKFAIRCTELEWKTASIEKQALEGRLMAMGYDTSELNFYPNKPYLATFYKSKPGKLGTTNTPAKENRRVIETWNAELVYALCCQLEGDAITPGEFLTDNNGKIHQSTRVDDKWIIVDYPGGKNDAFKKPQCHKSTFDELVNWFTLDSIEPTGVASATVSIDRTIKEPMKISSIIFGSDKRNGIQKTMGPIPPMKSMHHLSESDLDLVDKMTTDVENFGNGIVESRDLFALQAIKSIPDIKPPITGPMTFKEILSWFGEGNDVVVGSIEDNEIKCAPHTIEGISRDAVAMYDLEKPVPFDQIYKSKEAFLLHALTTLKKQA